MEQQSHALVVLCDTAGTICQVIRDELGLTRGAGGESISTLVDPACVMRINRMITSLRSGDAVLDQGIRVVQDGRPLMVQMAAARKGEDVLVVAACHAVDMKDVVQELVRVVQDRSHALRATTDVLVQRTHGKPVSDMELYDEMSRLNSELANAQRELARKNAELARLYSAEQKRVQTLSAVHQATLALLETLQPQPLREKVLDAAMLATPDAYAACLVGSDEPEQAWEVLAVRGVCQLSAGERVERQCACMVRAHGSSRPVQERGPDCCWRELGNIHEPAPVVGSSTVVLPLRQGNRAHGALALCRSTEKELGADELKLLETFAAGVSMAMGNARLHQEVSCLAITDPLTGVLNRRGFMEAAQRELTRALRFERPLAVMMLDVDHFKSINDTRGHACGDAVLKELVNRCRGILRDVDVIGRLGGEEFAVMLSELDLRQAVGVAERMRQSVSQVPVATSAGVVNVTVSVGVAVLRGQALRMEELLERVDRAVYRAKDAGRNRVKVWEGDVEVDKGLAPVTASD